MPAHIIHGDTFLVSRAVRRIRQENGLEELFESNDLMMSAAKNSAQELIDACNTMPFLDAARLVTIEGVLATRERQQSRTAGRRRQQSSDQWDQLADAIPAMPPTSHLILIDQEVASNNAVLRTLSPHCHVHAQRAPSGTQLRHWIRDAVHRRSSTIEPGAIALMEELIGPDLWSMDREVEKLTLYCSGRAINDQDVRLMVAKAKEANIFATLDAIFEGRTGPALQMLTRVMEDGAEPLQVIAMIARQIRLIALAKDLSPRRVAQDLWPRELGFTSDFVARKAQSQSRRFTAAEVKQVYSLATRADLDIKTGALDPRIAVETLAISIATL